MSKTTKIFYASDLHGSERCWRKFLNAGRVYDADVIIMGGDITGKLIIPILEGASGTYTCEFYNGRSVRAGAELEELERSIHNVGYYPVTVTPDELAELEEPAARDELFRTVMLKDFERWLQIAEDKLRGSGIRCFVSPGNDDIWDLDDILQHQSIVEVPDGCRLMVDEEHEIIGVGWATPTPWNTERECSEDDYAAKIEALIGSVTNMSTAIFDFHSPPYDTGLDSAPAITAELKPITIMGQPEMRPVGSRAVRSAVERYQPLLGLFGHVHESKGLVRLQRTLCVNPGSEYTEGALCGALLGINGSKVVQFQLLTG